MFYLYSSSVIVHTLLDGTMAFTQCNCQRNRSRRQLHRVNTQLRVVDDLRLRSRGFDTLSCVTTLDKLFTPLCPCHKTVQV